MSVSVKRFTLIDIKLKPATVFAAAKRDGEAHIINEAGEIRMKIFPPADASPELRADVYDEAAGLLRKYYNTPQAHNCIDLLETRAEALRKASRE